MNKVDLWICAGISWGKETLFSAPLAFQNDPCWNDAGSFVSDNVLSKAADWYWHTIHNGWFLLNELLVQRVWGGGGGGCLKKEMTKLSTQRGRSQPGLRLLEGGGARRGITYGVLGHISSSRLCYSLKMSLSTKNKSIAASAVGLCLSRSAPQMGPEMSSSEFLKAL